MAKTTIHSHPHPTRYLIQQYVGLGLLVIMLAAIPFQLFLAVALNGLLFGLTAVTLLLLAAPMVMLLRVSPSVTIDDDGLLLQPLIGRSQRVAWDEIAAIQPYTLLPRADHEAERRVLQGRKKYRAAAGKMLIIPALPVGYRFAGFFAGAGGQPVIALTNRTHTDYEQLIQRVERYWTAATTGK